MNKSIKRITLFAVIFLVAVGFYWLLIRPNTYTYDTALKNGDVVMGASGVANVEKLYAFIENTEHSQADQIRITAYTKEGNAIIFDLEFDGEIIQCTSDHTRDRYGITLFKEYGEYNKVVKDERNDYFLVDDTEKHDDLWIFQE